MPNPQDLQGQLLFDADGGELGVIEGVYLDNATRAPEWAAVRLGPDALALLPLAGAVPAGVARKAKEEAAEVAGTAQESTDVVKRTGRRSTTAVKGMAKRSARAAAAVG